MPESSSVTPGAAVDLEDDEDIDVVIGRAIAAIRAERQKTHPDVEGVWVSKARLAAIAEVVQTARTLSAGWGHSLPGRAWCSSPGNCTWEQQADALARLDALEHAQRNAQAVTQLQADMEAKAG